MRSLLRTVVVLLLVALPLSAQDCKLGLETGQSPTSFPLTELEDSAVARGALTRLCHAGFPWRNDTQERVWPASSEMAEIRREVRATNALIRDHRVRERFSNTLNRAALAGRDEAAKAEYVKLITALGSEEWFVALPSHMQRYAVKVVVGVDPRYADRFATLFYYLVLRKEGNYAAIAADGVAQSTKIRDVPTLERVTTLDKKTFYSKDAVDAALYLLAIEARARTTAKTAADYLELLAAYDAAPREALGRVELPFHDDANLKTRLAGALQADSHPTSPLLLGSRVSDESNDYYVRLNDRVQPQLVRYVKATRTVEILRGNDAWRILEAGIRKDLRAADRRTMILASVLRDGTGFSVETASGTFAISAGEYAQLRRGDPLPPDHALSKALTGDAPFVIYSNPLMRSGRFLADAEEFGFAVQSAYPNAAVIRDDYTSETAARATALQAIGQKQPSEIVAVVDEGSFHVQDMNVLPDIEDGLKAKGWSVVNYKPGTPWQQGRGKAVMVITGHIDEGLAKFVRALGEAGYFRDNFVVLNTCYTTASTELVAEINQKFGARACLRHEGKIAPYRVGELLKGVASDVAQPARSESLLEVLQRRLNALKLHALWVICRLEDRHGNGAETSLQGA